MEDKESNNNGQLLNHIGVDLSDNADAFNGHVFSDMITPSAVTDKQNMYKGI